MVSYGIMVCNLQTDRVYDEKSAIPQPAIPQSVIPVGHPLRRPLRRHTHSQEPSRSS